MRMLVLTFALSACSGPPPPVISIRTGEPDANGPTVSQVKSAVLLANLDDDDGDGVPDADDEQVNGVSDIEDLTIVSIEPWPLAPEEAVGQIEIAAPAEKIRLFRVSGPETVPASFRPLAAAKLALTATDLKSGFAFAVEGRGFLSERSGWDGKVSVRYTVEKGMEKLGEDAITLRLAPLIFQHNLSLTQRVFYSDGGFENADFAGEVEVALSDAALKLEGFPFEEVRFDPWAQDFFDIGYTSKPGPNNTVVGLHVFLRSAQPDREAGGLVEKFLGPNVAALTPPGNGGNNEYAHTWSMNSYGNWDVIPPYSKGAESYPYGRNIWGAGDTSDEQPEPTFTEFVRAQRVQSEFIIDTSWLLVGHVDEIFSFVKSNSPRGWALLVSSPAHARALLQAQMNGGNGAARMFVGKQNYGDNWQPRPADRAIDSVLQDPDLMAASQRDEIKTQTQLKKLQEEVGLRADEIFYLPFLTEDIQGGSVAYQPGIVNLFHFDGHVIIAEPFGPSVNGVDIIKADVEKRLASLGLKIHYADDWDVYHLGFGEVHCATNAARQMDAKWWEVTP